ncbi:putative ABC transport system permease protein [Stackebrandtia endophytica]|uniref:Putative ABC transport system permease protein n=1 Tax=Stackebrandtia endophytica TaxID=1496996 RepID=A0A543AV40_9ACTN|nr:ABC transporter permease [Stackebrandtia endophytica]TQL76450.1 putative ABC transport system permease protein [Stackebrandtia endophytica]
MARVRWRDLVGEAISGVLSRPGRAALTALGTVLGVGTLVTILGLTATAGGQISERFDVLKATEVTVEDTLSDTYLNGPGFSAAAEDRVRGIEGVTEAGIYGGVEELPVSLDLVDSGTEYPLVAATPGALAAVEPHLVAGRGFDRYHEDSGARVAMLSAGLATRLGIDRLSEQPAIFINGVPLTVIGIYDDTARKSAEFLLAVVVPVSTAAGFTDQAPTTMVVATRPGAASVVAGQLAVAVNPAGPERYRVSMPPDPQALAEGVSADLQALFLGLAAVCLFIGMLGIANTTLVAVMERFNEFGLRRAVGAHRRHVYTQVMIESGLLGSIGGLVGVAIGVLSVVAVAVAQQWTAVLDLWVVLVAPGVGVGSGLLAGLYPAWRASRVEPVEALRR